MQLIDYNVIRVVWSLYLELKPALVIMDIDIPKMNGVEATAVLKQSLPETKVLIFTSSENISDISAALQAGADGYCLKTISAEMLSVAVQALMKGTLWLDPEISQTVLRAKKEAAKKNQLRLSDSKLRLLSMLEEGKDLSRISSEFEVGDLIVKGLLQELIMNSWVE